MTYVIYTACWWPIIPRLARSCSPPGGLDTIGSQQRTATRVDHGGPGASQKATVGRCGWLRNPAPVDR